MRIKARVGGGNGSCCDSCCGCNPSWEYCPFVLSCLLAFCSSPSIPGGGGGGGRGPYSMTGPGQEDAKDVDDDEEEPARRRKVSVKPRGRKVRRGGDVPMVAKRLSTEQTESLNQRISKTNRQFKEQHLEACHMVIIEQRQRCNSERHLRSFSVSSVKPNRFAVGC